eukprot:TRINITY_DN7803_c1_g2_i1.p1 TRINITY_DN7803_c1_g2~~TRINITY_DN7803_c1_g2_i1.p1  ORF type:complete len:1196 (-),score=101.03 TRINITY_DN7803_c1_g2_i1:185-3772(-)
MLLFIKLQLLFMLVGTEMVSPVYSSCSENDIGVRKRIDIHGSSMPVGIWGFNWPSGELVAHIFRILSSEVLGYETIISGIGGTSASALYAIAGCRYPNDYHDDAKCSAVDLVRGHHLSLEVWDSSIADRLSEINSLEGLPIPERSSSMGYDGFETIFVLKESRVRAMENRGLPLEYYKTFNASWNDLSSLFESHDGVELSKLQPCEATLMMNHRDMANYLTFTTDVGGVQRRADGSLRAKCWNTSWWLAPSCRHVPHKCIPVVTGGNGWLLYFIMQAAAQWNMPWAVSVAADFSTYLALPRSHSSLLYWWTPDTSFIDLGPEPILFPEADQIAWISGDKSYLMQTVKLWKFVAPSFKGAAPDVAVMLDRLQISKKHMDEALLSVKLSNLTIEELACQWVKTNKRQWSAWIPSPDECVPGQGIIGSDGNFVENSSLAVGCRWCVPGRWSEPKLDVYYCSLCQPGTASSLPGQTECYSCRMGTFSAEAGSNQCSLCAVGTYQSRDQSTACEACAHHLTTELPGTAHMERCVCNAGTFRALQNSSVASDVHCRKCPPGMVCPVGSMELDNPCMTKQNAEDGSPLPLPVALPGFWVGCKEPLRAFRCIRANECPGGSFARCTDEFREGVACGRCAHGYIPDFENTKCTQCNVTIGTQVSLGISIFVFMVLLILFLHGLSHNISKDWSSFNATIPCLIYIMFVFIQVSGIYATLDVDSPASVSRITTTCLQVLHVDHIIQNACVHSYWDRRARFWIELLAPLEVLAVFIITYCLSNAVLSRLRSRWKLDHNVGFSNYGSFFITFFISIAKRALDLFHCYNHPDGSKSLHRLPDVLCYTGEWFQLAVPSASMVALCCIGSLTTFSVVIRVAPSKFSDVGFRRRWQFLFMRFRPNRWWWSVVLVLRGTLCSLAGVVCSSCVSQLLWVEVTLLLYVLCCVVAMPWNSLCITICDIICSSALCLLGTLVAASARCPLIKEEVSLVLHLLFAVPFITGAMFVFAMFAFHMIGIPDRDYHHLSKNLVAVMALLDVGVMEDIMKKLPMADLIQAHSGISILQQELKQRVQLLDGLPPAVEDCVDRLPPCRLSFFMAMHFRLARQRRLRFSSATDLQGLNYGEFTPVFVQGAAVLPAPHIVGSLTDRESGPHAGRARSPNLEVVPEAHVQPPTSSPHVLESSDQSPCNSPQGNAASSGSASTPEIISN